jgi:ferric-dicitrate binding protein FerR (iron transport regulator)
MTHDPQPPPPADDIERLLRAAGARALPDPRRRAAARAAVHDAWRSSVHAHTRRTWIVGGGPVLAAAATLLLGVLFWRPPAPSPAPDVVVARVRSLPPGVQLRGDPSRPLRIGDAVHAGAVVVTPDTGVAAVLLDGGGELRQNAATVVRWTAARRIALEHGQVYVDSGDSTAAPVAIETWAGVIRDIGTRFDVQVRGDEVRVRVREGRVRLESPAGPRDAAAGVELVATPDGAVADRPIAIAGPGWDWMLQATAFRLEGATLAQFASWVEDEGGFDLEFHPARLRDDTAATVLHGSVQGLSMRDALDAVFPAVGLTHRVESQRIVIERTAAGSVR